MGKLDPNFLNHLQRSHKFDTYVIANSLSLQDAESVTSGMVLSVMAQIRVEYANAVPKQVKHQAEQIQRWRIFVCVT